ncbi:hypothetical protein A2U01_0026520 [Trifolium medium]|uniref:Uncharacterized protein n=1 Tax=Trifolium medium TaxID=97028 RepID=A0A392P0C7_9FABA|nr:hypothetical protein [Trifolium medium]
MNPKLSPSPLVPNLSNHVSISDSVKIDDYLSFFNDPTSNLLLGFVVGDEGYESEEHSNMEQQRWQQRAWRPRRQRL